MKRTVLKAVFCMLAVLGLSAFTTSEKDDKSDVHAGIIRDALSGTICSENVIVLVNGSRSQDQPGYDAKSEPQRHFESDLKRGYHYVQQEQMKALNFACDADSDPESRTRALYHFGKMLHTVQDFYSNSNYVRLMIGSKQDSGSDFDPYSIGIFDWSKLQDASPVYVAGKELKIEADKNNRQRWHDEKVGETTLGKVARGLAIEETIRQWSFMENLIKRKYGERASQILVALKEASCVLKEPPEAASSSSSSIQSSSK
ncbi:MAG: hypothetical protein K2Z81_22100 [Cyanobacteria bacterium]|nr:hypothetical protein [Cyanobacteriota bacterium]